MSGLFAAREYVAAMVRAHGLKRGLHLAGVVMRCSERWARAIHYGEARAVSREVSDRAAAAHIDLVRARAAQIRAELHEIERGLDAGDLDAPGAHGEAQR